MKVIEAAKYLIYLSYEKETYSLTPLKLQKLLYFAQGWSYVWDNKPLFNAEFEAWQYGPVCPKVYNEFKSYKDNEIPKSEGSKNVRASKEELETLELVWEKYGSKGAFKLVDLSHKEAPWKNAKAYGEVIRNEDIRRYYKKLYS